MIWTLFPGRPLGQLVLTVLTFSIYCHLKFALCATEENIKGAFLFTFRRNMAIPTCKLFVSSTSADNTVTTTEKTIELFDKPIVVRPPEETLGIFQNLSYDQLTASTFFFRSSFPLPTASYPLPNFRIFLRREEITEELEACPANEDLPEDVDARPDKQLFKVSFDLKFHFRTSLKMPTMSLPPDIHSLINSPIESKLSPYEKNIKPYLGYTIVMCFLIFLLNAHDNYEKSSVSWLSIGSVIVGVVSSLLKWLC